MSRDCFDRLARMDYPSAVVGGGPSPADHEAWTYDPAGNLLTARDRAGRVVSFSYDALTHIGLHPIIGRLLLDPMTGPALCNSRA